MYVYEQPCIPRAHTTNTGYIRTDPSGFIAGDVEDANTKTPFSAQETVLKAHQSERVRERKRETGIQSEREDRSWEWRRQQASALSLLLATSRLPLNQCRIRQVRQSSGPVPREHGRQRRRGWGPNAIAFNCESGRNCRTNYATPKVAKNFLANDQNVEKGSSSSRSGKPGGKLLSQLFEMISI